MLKFAGAVRLSQIVEGVTHVVAAEKDSGSLLMLNMNPLCPSPPIVNLQWLVKSMERGEPVPLDNDDQDHCQLAQETQIEAKLEGCNEEDGGFEEKLLAQYAALGVPRNQTAFW